MRSSISSSKGLRVALVVVVGLLGLELFTRLKLFAMSKDFRRFAGYGELAATVARPGDVAFVGNSATEHGIDPRIFAEALASATGQPARVERFTADASRVNTWYFMIERYFWRPARHPGRIILTFYEDDLADGNRVEIGRVAQFFTTWADWPAVMGIDLPELTQRVEFVASSLWATYAARARIRERTLGLIPGYGDFLVRSNDALFKHAHRAGPPRAPATRTYHALERLLARARAAGTPLVFVAYPPIEAAKGHPYELDPAMVAILRDAGAPLVDLRRVPEIGPELYVDDVHLGAEGRALYSRICARALAAAVGQ